MDYEVLLRGYVLRTTHLTVFRYVGNGLRCTSKRDSSKVGREVGKVLPGPRAAGPVSEKNAKAQPGD